MFCALQGQDISGERLQDHWSNGYRIHCFFLLEKYENLLQSYFSTKDFSLFVIFTFKILRKR